MKRNHLILGYIMAISGGILWAIGGVCGECLFKQQGVTSNWLVPIRLFVSGIIVLFWSEFTGKKPFRIFHTNNLLKDLPTLLLFSFLGSAMCQYGYYTSIQYSNAAFGTVMSYISPTFIMLWVMFKKKRFPYFYEAISVIFVIFGSVSCATHGDLTQLSVAPQALFWGIFSSMCFAFYTLSPQKLMVNFGVLPITGWGMLIGGTAMMVYFHPWSTYDVYLGAIGFLRLTAVILLGTVFAFTLFQSGCSIIGGLAASTLSSVEPLCSVILSVIILHHNFVGMDFLGFAFILLTIPLVTFGQMIKIKKNESIIN